MTKVKTILIFSTKKNTSMRCLHILQTILFV